MSFFRFGLIALMVFFSASPVCAAEGRDPEAPQVAEVQEEIKKAPESSFQLVQIGRIVAADSYHHWVRVMDKYRRIATYYLKPGLESSFAKGTTVQMKLEPGSNRIESIQKING